MWIWANSGNYTIRSHNFHNIISFFVHIGREQTKSKYNFEKLLHLYDNYLYSLHIIQHGDNIATHSFIFIFTCINILSQKLFHVCKFNCVCFLKCTLNGQTLNYNSFLVYICLL